MTATEALSQWTDCCVALVVGEVVFLNGNREPLAAKLAHYPDTRIEETELASPRSDWKAVLKVLPSGESKQAAFYLCVE